MTIADSSAFHGSVSPAVRRPARASRIAQRSLSTALSKWKAAKNEAQQLFRMAESWPERFSVARFMTQLHLARAFAFDSYSWDTAVLLHGTKYCLGLRTSEIYVVEEVFRYKMYDRRDDFLPEPGWVVFDIGANIGIVSVLQARRNAVVYAFEPNPDCYRRLLKTIAVNALEGKIHAFNLAVSDLVGIGEMQLEKKGGTTGGKVVVGGTAKLSNAAVNVTALDKMVPALNVTQIDLLKIDVEGAEVEVLRGAAQTLLLTKRIILEYHSRALLEEVEAILKPYGFERRVLVEYYPEDMESSQEEVGITYYSRSAGADLAD